MSSFLTVNIFFHTTFQNSCLSLMIGILYNTASPTLVDSSLFVSLAGGPPAILAHHVRLQIPLRR